LVILFVYYPSLWIGFFAQDYDFLNPVAQLDTPAYLNYVLDPRAQILWYRPLQGLQILIEFALFGSNPVPYHWVQIIFHIASCALLFALVGRVARRGAWRIALLAALFYATFPVYALAVNWINITDPLMTIFYLLGVWFWLNYLERESKCDYLVVLAAFVFALLNKQMAITLPIVLFLIDRLLIAQPTTWRALIRRYAALVVVAGIFAVVQYATRSTHTFAQVFGYALGAQILSMLIQYLSLLVFPWGYYPPTDTQITEGFPFADTGNLIWLAGAIILVAFLAASRKNRGLIFLGGAILVTLVPVLPFPFIELRYLYLPAMSSGILLALWFDHALDVLKNAGWAKIAAALALGGIVIGSGLSVASANAGIAEIARQRRVPFRDIERKHPTFPEGTHLYFIDPISPLPELTGMFLMRYGRAVNVGGDRAPTDTRLRDFKNVFVYHFDATGKPIEIQADVKTALQTSAAFPVAYDQPIVLDDVEIAQPRVKRGDVLIALLHFHASDNLDRNYTIFVHLVDAQGNIVAGYDNEPRKGAAPTSQWTRYAPVVDPIVMPIPSSASFGDAYRLEIGLYDLSTMRRLVMVDARGQPLGDALVMQPLSVIE
ncbi:MAG: glycosyltransferase family 39 protein, partial [Chloroflexota bacterium]